MVIVGAHGLPAGVGSDWQLAERMAAATSAKSLTITLTEDADTLDPGATGLESTYQVTQSMFDPLFYSFPGMKSRYHPGLATSYTISPDATQYTFKLRQGVVFHDGTPFNAAAVKANFDHIVDPNTKSQSAISILGPSYSAADVIDDYTVRVTFSSPNASFVDEMTAQPFGMSSPTAMAKYGADYGTHPVGTGPFVFQEWVTGQQITVTRNPRYTWGPPAVGNAGPAHLQKVTYRVLTDPSTQASALRTGAIQVGQNLTPQDVQQLVGESKFKKFMVPATGMTFCYTLNVAKSPTDELKVRQALNWATNQKSIVTRLFQGLYTPATSVFDPKTPGFSAEQHLYSYNPKKANQLLEAAGWRKGSDGTRRKNGQELALSIVNISTFGEFGFDNMAQLLQAEYQQIGATCTIEDQPTPTAHTTFLKGLQNLASSTDYDVSPYFIHSAFGGAYIATGGNHAHYSNAAFDKAVTAANAIVSNDKRNSAYGTLGKQLMEQAVLIPLYDKLSVYVGPASMKGFVYTSNAVPVFTAVTY